MSDEIVMKPRSMGVTTSAGFVIMSPVQWEILIAAEKDPYRRAMLEFNHWQEMKR